MNRPIRFSQEFREKERALRNLVYDAGRRHRSFEKQIYIQRWQELARAERLKEKDLKK